MMNDTKVKKGGIDTVVAYIVVALPLTYLLVFTIGIIYHFSVQSYVSQVAKELAITAGTHGQLTSKMIERANLKLSNLDVGDFQIAIKVKEYDVDTNSFSEKRLNYGPINYDSHVENLYSASTGLTDNKLHQRDIIEIYLQSKDNSILASIANFGMFGGGSGTESALKYSSFREEIVRNDPS